MNQALRPKILASACPHDCPSTCALEVEVFGRDAIGRVRGAADNGYTAGVICAKVARYAERVHHPDRLKQPLRRVGAKGSGEFAPISWDDALDLVAEQFLRAEAKHGSETVWPYLYAGTMGYVMRDGIHRLRHAKKYSGFFSTICVNPAWTGFIAGTGKLAGTDPREMAKSDLVVIWGTNAVNTQINVMTACDPRPEGARRQDRRGRRVHERHHAAGRSAGADPARHRRRARLRGDALPVPRQQGRLGLPRALHRCAARARRAFAQRATRNGRRGSPARRWKPSKPSPAWSVKTSAPTSGSAMDFRARATARLNMHAASCIAAVIGAWRYEGGGAFHNNGAIFHLDATLIEGTDVRDASIRMLDQSRIGAILTGDDDALLGGPPVTAMLIQNTNPVSVAPDQEPVKRGFARDDLFVCVHEQFMTDTAKMADVVLPATMFVEHDDFYTAGGSQYILLGPKLIEPPGECRSNHEVICGLAKRLGAEHPGFDMTPRELIDATLQKSGWGTLADLEANRWIDCQPDFATAHYLNGFAYPDGKFRFKPDWPTVPLRRWHRKHAPPSIPKLPDHWDVIEEAEPEHPFRLATSPARGFLNSSFTETPTSLAGERRPEVMIHPEDAAALAVGNGEEVVLGNRRGKVRLHARLFDGVRRGVLIAESLWPNSAYADGRGINTLTGADPVAPFGGAAFHDNKVWLRKLN